MSDSILETTKNILGVGEDYDAFDLDIMTHINSALASLGQLGIGPADGFMITDADPTWEAFIGENKVYNMVKSVVFLKVKMLFDPPTTSYTQAAMERQIAEMEWRLSVARESKEWTPPVVEDQLPTGNVLDGGEI